VDTPPPVAVQSSLVKKKPLQVGSRLQVVEQAAEVLTGWLHGWKYKGGCPQEAFLRSAVLLESCDWMRVPATTRRDGGGLQSGWARGVSI